MDQHPHWWQPALDWLQENAVPLLGAAASALSGFVLKNVLFRSGIDELRAEARALREDWRAFMVRFDALEVERAEYRRLAAVRMDDLAEQVADLRTHIGDCVGATEQKFDTQVADLRAHIAEQLLLTDQRLNQLAQTNADLATQLATAKEEEHKLFRLLLEQQMGKGD